MKSIVERPLPVRIGTKWGYIDVAGRVLRDATYDYAGEFKDGLGHARLGSWLALLDSSFHQLGMVPNAHSYSAPSEGLLAVQDDMTQRDYFVDERGRNPFGQEFDHARNFSEGLAFVRCDEKWGLLDRNGKWVVEPEFAWGESFQAGSEITSVQRAKGTGYCLIDKAGRLISDRQHEQLRCVSEGLIPFGKRVEGEMLYGVIDATGREIVPPVFHECDAGYHDGLLGVETQDGSWGVIDRVGSWVIQPQYPYIGSYRDGHLLTYRGGGRTLDRTLIGGKFGFVSREGRETVGFQFDEAFPFDDGIANVDWYADRPPQKKKLPHAADHRHASDSARAGSTKTTKSTSMAEWPRRVWNKFFGYQTYTTEDGHTFSLEPGLRLPTALLQDGDELLAEYERVRNGTMGYVSVDGKIIWREERQPQDTGGR